MMKTSQCVFLINHINCIMYTVVHLENDFISLDEVASCWISRIVYSITICIVLTFWRLKLRGQRTVTSLLSVLSRTKKGTWASWKRFESFSFQFGVIVLSAVTLILFLLNEIPMICIYAAHLSFLCWFGSKLLFKMYLLGEIRKFYINQFDHLFTAS